MRLPCHANETNGGDSPAQPSFLALLFPTLSKVSLGVVSLLVLAWCTLALSPTAHAQSTAAIEGQVIDPNGAAVPAIQIVANVFGIRQPQQLTVIRIVRVQVLKAAALGIPYEREHVPLFRPRDRRRSRAP